MKFADHKSLENSYRVLEYIASKKTNGLLKSDLKLKSQIIWKKWNVTQSIQDRDTGVG